MPEWKTIDSAPKSRQQDMRAAQFLAWCPDGEAPGGGDVRVCWWEPVMKCWYGDCDFKLHPSHWMPLPTPPGQQAQ